MKINTEQICTVEIYEKAINSHYYYKKERKVLGIKIRKEGFYSRFLTEDYEPKELIENDKTLFCEGRKVYYKPHVEIRMSNQKLIVKYFNTVAELIVFMHSDEMKNINWINN